MDAHQLQTPPAVDRPTQSGLAAQMTAMLLKASLMGMLTQHKGLQRAGITKNKGIGESKARRQMAKASRRRNRVR